MTAMTTTAEAASLGYRTGPTPGALIGQPIAHQGDGQEMRDLTASFLELPRLIRRLGDVDRVERAERTASSPWCGMPRPGKRTT